MKLLLSFLILAALLVLVESAVFTATDELEALADNQKLLIKELIAIKEKFKIPSDHYVSRKLSEHQSEIQLMEKDAALYIYNPLNAFLLIKRLTVDVFTIQSHLKTFLTNPHDFESYKQTFKQISLKYSDLVGAIEGLLRLQKIYKLKSSDFAEGIIDGQKTRSSLSTHDLFVIGKEASKLEKQEFFAFEYFRLTLNKINKDGSNNSEVNLEDLYSLLSSTHNKTGNFKEALHAIDGLLKLDDSNQSAKLLKTEYLKNFKTHGNSKLTIFNPFDENHDRNGKYSQLKESVWFGKACRGELKKSDKEMSKLRCRYFSTNFFSKLAPFKMEESSLQPTFVALFHDVMSDGEIELVKNLTRLQLTPGMIQNLDKKLPKSRVTKTTFIDDRRHKVIAKLSKRVEDMTGLTIETAEPFQVQNYGIGGHYAPHWDAQRLEDKPFELGTGNRIATALFYMSDVDNGGYTVFPALNIRVPPIKGTAVLWFNVHDSGEVDFFTRHASCPVLLGSKWVSNKWLHEFGQEFRKPCKLEKTREISAKEYDRILY